MGVTLVMNVCVFMDMLTGLLYLKEPDVLNVYTSGCVILKPNINWNFTIMVDEAHTLHQKAACHFVLQKLQYYDMMLLHDDSIPSLMSWSVLAVEDDRGLMGAPVTCLLLCLSCGRPSGACDETMTAQSKEKLAPVNHKENPLWFSRSERETTSPGTCSK